MDIAQTALDLFLTCALFLALFAASSFIFKQRNGRMFSLLALNICLFIMAFAYLMLRNATSLRMMIDWDTVKLSGLMAFPSVWCFLALDLTIKNLKHRLWIAGTLMLFPLIFIVLRLTDATYALFYGAFTHFEGLLTWGLASVKGMAYLFFIAYMLVACLTALIVYFGAAVRYIGKTRRLLVLYLFIALLPLIGLMAEFFIPVRTGLDFLTLGALAGGILLSISILASDIRFVETIAKDALFKHDEDPLILTDDAGRMLDFNMAADALFPQLDPEVVGLPLQDILAREEHFFQRIDHPMKPDLEIKKGDTVNYYEIKSTPANNAWGRSVGRVIRLVDVTKKRKESDAMHRLATRDSLTGLLNRRQFISLAKLALQRDQIDGSGLAVIVFDLDRFKAINDTYGAAVGDEVLRTVGNLLLSHFRKSDLVGRIGGEEFAILLPSTQGADALKLAEKCCTIIRETTIVLQDQTIRLTLSGGVASTPSLEADLDLIMKSADAALREAKEKGRDRVSFAEKGGAKS
jgi:diguanylate cyclase (GGDEF)-like protein